MPPIHSLPSPLFSASKWVSISVLLSEKDLEELFQLIDSYHLFPLKNPVISLSVNKEKILQGYKQALQNIREKKEDFSSFLQLLPIGITQQKEAFYRVSKDLKTTLLHWKEAAILWKPFFFRYSPLDESFRTNILGKENIFWGMQFSFPYIYYDPIEKQVKKVNPKEDKNCELFGFLRKWIRSKTVVVSFAQKKAVSFRISKSWENPFSHFQLEKENLILQLCP